MHWRPGDPILLRGVYSRRVAWALPHTVAVRAEGERVLAAWPFPTDWEEFRPDPTWPLPALPEGWEHVATR
jgi:hypothetical protein